MRFRQATIDDIPFIRDIYNSTVASRTATADVEPASYASMESWFHSHHAGRPVLIASYRGEDIGYISFRDFYGRPAYQGTAEISLYIHASFRGMGYGKQMLRHAITVASTLGIHTLLAFIFSHNEQSIRLVTAEGFREWGHLPDIAEMDGKQYSLKILGRRIEGDNQR